MMHMHIVPVHSLFPYLLQQRTIRHISHKFYRNFAQRYSHVATVIP